MIWYLDTITNIPMSRFIGNGEFGIGGGSVGMIPRGVPMMRRWRSLVEGKFVYYSSEGKKQKVSAIETDTRARRRRWYGDRQILACTSGRLLKVAYRGRYWRTVLSLGLRLSVAPLTKD